MYMVAFASVLHVYIYYVNGHQSLVKSSLTFGTELDVLISEVFLFLVFKSHLCITHYILESLLISEN